MAQMQALPLSSPFRRCQVWVCRVRSATFTEPLYVVPFGHRVILVTSWDNVHTVVRVENVQALCGLLGEASKTNQPRNLTSAPGDTDRDMCGGVDGKRIESRWEPVLLEERVLLADIKRLAGRYPILLPTLNPVKCPLTTSRTAPSVSWMPARNSWCTPRHGHG